MADSYDLFADAPATPAPVEPGAPAAVVRKVAELRAQLQPRAPRSDPAELIALGERYARATGYPIQYQWTLIEGVNDSEDEIEGIARLLEGQGIEVRITDGRSYRGGIRGNFSYRDDAREGLGGDEAIDVGLRGRNDCLLGGVVGRALVDVLLGNGIGAA